MEIDNLLKLIRLLKPYTKITNFYLIYKSIFSFNKADSPVLIEKQENQSRDGTRASVLLSILCLLLYLNDITSKRSLLPHPCSRYRHTVTRT